MMTFMLALLSAAFAMDADHRDSRGGMNLDSVVDDTVVKIHGMRDEARANPFNTYNESGRSQRKATAGAQSDKTNVSQDRIDGWDQRGNDRYEKQVNDNFCRYLTNGVYKDFGSCSATTAVQEQLCKEGKMFHAHSGMDGQAADGNFTVCGWDEAAKACVDLDQRHCPWTVHMMALELAQNASTATCFQDILESKRSLDGLLKWVNETYLELMEQTEMIRLANYTIHMAIVNQSKAEQSMIDCKIECDNDAIRVNETTLGLYEHQLHILERIADPDVRSKVSELDDFDLKGSQHFDAAHQVAENAWESTSMDDQARKANIRINGIADRGAASFVQLDEVANVDKKRWSLSNMFGFSNEYGDAECDAARRDLEGNFTSAWNKYKDAYRLENIAIQERRFLSQSRCESIYHIKINGECGPPFPDYSSVNPFTRADDDLRDNYCVDSTIVDAAAVISTAQGVIAVLEPRLHDLEHAVHRMRTHIQRQNVTCSLDSSMTARLREVHRLITLISECPGRNDFVITVPHWRPGDGVVTPVVTPAPTPWTERDPTAAPTVMKERYLLINAAAFEPAVSADAGAAADAAVPTGALIENGAIEA